MLSRAALRLNPPVPPDPRWRDRHDLAEHRHIARADPRGPPDDQRRPVAIPERPAAPQRRHHVPQPERHRQPGTGNPAIREAGGSMRRDRVQRHKRLLW